MTQFIYGFLEIILLIPDCKPTQHTTLSLSMGYNSAHVNSCDHRWPIRRKISNAQRSIAVALPMLRRAARKHRRWITKPSAILSYRICIADVYTTIADVSPMCRRCVADVSGTILALVYIAECSQTARRCSAIYRRWYLASKHRE